MYCIHTHTVGLYAYFYDITGSGNRVWSFPHMVPSHYWACVDLSWCIRQAQPSPVQSSLTATLWNIMFPCVLKWLESHKCGCLSVLHFCSFTLRYFIFFCYQQSGSSGSNNNLSTVPANQPNQSRTHKLQCQSGLGDHVNQNIQRKI